jgi:hypothetical protein
MLKSKSSGQGKFAPLKILFGLAVLASSLQTAYASQSDSSVTLHYRYTLTDLDPLDNVAPSLTVTTNYRYIYGESNNVEFPYSLYQEYDEDTASPMTGSATLGADRLASSITGSAQGAGETLSASTFSTSTDDNTPYEDLSHDAGAGRAFDGILSANTAITFYLDYSLSATGLNQPFHQALSSLGFRMWHDPDADPRPSDFFLFNYQEEVYAGNTRSFSATRTYENKKSSAELIGSDVILRTWSWVPLEPSQVPEPAPYVMFATGLALLAWRKRRATGHIG